MHLKPGDIVGAPCQIRNTSAPGEYLVALDTLHGPCIARSRIADVFHTSDDRAQLWGLVKSVNNGVLRILLKADLVTRGPVEFSWEWAKEHIWLAKPKDPVVTQEAPPSIARRKRPTRGRLPGGWRPKERVHSE